MAEGKIYKAIVNTMKDIGVVGKGDSNTFDNYKYRGIDAVINALNPAMIKNGIFVVPTVLETKREERQGKSQLMMYTVLTVKYTFYADDGSSIDVVVVGEAMDRSDKSTNKAMSAAFKYACFQTFCIPTEEMQDADAESPEIGKKTTNKVTQKTEEQLNQDMAAKVDQDLVPHGEGMTPQRVKRVLSELERTGVTIDTILGAYKVKDIKEFTEEQYISCINRLLKTKGKA
jgi:hypothetical protein